MYISFVKRKTTLKHLLRYHSISHVKNYMEQDIKNDTSLHLF